MIASHASTATQHIKITVSFKGNTLSQSVLPKSDIIIGRGSDSDVILDNAGVSRAHAKLTLQHGQIEVQDLGSGNGTFVNGTQIEKRVLSKGDLIRIGKFTLNASLTDAAPQQTMANDDNDDLATNNSQRTVFLNPDERMAILKQGRPAIKAEAVKPSKASQPVANNSLKVFAAGIVTGLLISWLWGLF